MVNENIGGWKRYDADMKFYEKIRDEILTVAEQAGVSARQQLRLELGVEEILVNVFSYAYDDFGYIWLKTSVEGDCFRLEVADHGRPFDPLARDYRHAENVPLADRQPGGLGIFLVKKNFKSVVYCYEEMFGGMANHLTMLLQMK